jgi:hypothetical protein
MSATPRAIAWNVSPTLQFRREIKIDFEPKAPSGLRAVTTTSSEFHLGFALGAMLSTTADTSRSGCSVQAVTKAAATNANRIDFISSKLVLSSTVRNVVVYRQSGMAALLWKADIKHLAIQGPRADRTLHNLLAAPFARWLVGRRQRHAG